MAVIEGAVSLALAGVANQAQSGMHVICKPDAFGGLGHYDLSAISGSISAGIGVNAEIFQFRWTDATRFAIIKKISLTGMRATTAFAVGVINLHTIIARAWTVAGTGGAVLTMTGNNQKMRTNMGTSLVQEIRVISTSGLGLGTKTLDANPIGQVTTHSSAGVGSATPIIGSIYLPHLDLYEQDQADGEHPIVLAQNEGFVIRAEVPATGVWNLGFKIKWAELEFF